MENDHALILKKALDRHHKKAITQTTGNQITLLWGYGKVSKQFANHTIYKLSMTFMVEVTGLEPCLFFNPEKKKAT